MMRKTVLLATLAMFSFGGAALAQKKKNYEITVDGKKYDIGLNETLKAKTKGGKEVSIVLAKKQFAEFADNFVSFEHKSDLNVNSQDLGDGIRQLMMATAMGTVVMVQEYSNLDPSMLVPMLLKEVTKESVKYGHTMTQEESVRTLASGAKLSGLKATLTYQGAESYWEVLALGKQDRGILIVTHVSKEFMVNDGDVLRRFWKTLAPKF